MKSPQNNLRRRRNDGRTAEQGSTLRVFAENPRLGTSFLLQENVIPSLETGESSIFSISIPIEEIYEGLTHLRAIVESAGELVTADNTASMAIPC